MEQTQLNDGQIVFLEELAGLMAAINKAISQHELIVKHYEELMFTLARIENKIDFVHQDTCKTELVK